MPFLSRPGGDGRLTTALDPHDLGPQDACGVFGVWAPGEDVAKLTYFGLYALQHRGQESAGIAVSDGRQILVYKDMGLVSQVFDETTLDSLKGHLAIGHSRYSTTGASTWQNAQPTFRPTADGSIALGHNGNLINTHDLARFVEELPGPEDELPLQSRDLESSTNDTGLVTALLAHHPDTSLEQRALEVLPLLRGAFSFVWMNEDTLYAARDPQGIRPLVLGRLDRGWVVASEDAALATIGASVVREIEPGEMVVIDENGLRSHTFAEPARKGCVFEYVYLARPDATIAGRSVHEARVEMGRELARQFPVEADLVMPVPESANPAAAGYAEESGIPFGQGFVKNAYVGRTFIQPSQTLRQLGIRLKLNALDHMIRGRRIVVVDDSIVRGNTQRAQVRMLREAGALEVHVRISSPPVKWPCFYGIDFATRAELIANGLEVEEIRTSIGADSLGYLSSERMIEATGQDVSTLCQACFTGEYPIPLPDESLLGQAPARGHPGLADPRPGAAGAQQPLGRPCPTPPPHRRPPPPPRPPTPRPASSIEAAETAVDLMRTWVEKARRPEMIGGIGGFAGLFDASALTSYTRPLLATSTDGVGTKVASRPDDGRARHDRLRPGRHGRRRPGRLRRRAALHDRLHRHRSRRARADRRDRQGHRRGVPGGRLCADRRRDGRAPGSARARRVRRRRRHHRCGRGRPPAGARVGCDRATRCWPWPPAGCTPTATRWCVTCSSPRPAGRWTARCPSSAARWARSCSPRRGSTPRRVWPWPTRRSVHAMAHVTGGGLAANLERVLPVELDVVLERATWAPAPIFDLVRAVGGVSQPDLEATLNCGVGMVALLPPDGVDRRSPCSPRPASAPGSPVRCVPAEVGGQVRLEGQHPGW